MDFYIVPVATTADVLVGVSAGKFNIIAGRKIVRMLLILTIVFAPFHVYAMNTAGYHEIGRIYSWSDYTGSVIKMTLINQDDAAKALCPAGYWIDDASGMNANMLSVALSAYHAKTRVKVYANENDDWSGLSSKECKLKLIVLE